MIKQASSFGRNGVQDYVFTRATAVIIVLYVLWIVGFMLFKSDGSFIQWKSFFESNFNKVFTIITLISILIHAWIGLWQVFTDYVKNTLFRAILQFFVVTVLMVYVIYGFFILWGA